MAWRAGYLTEQQVLSALIEYESVTSDYTIHERDSMWRVYDALAANPVTKDATIFYGCEAMPATAAKNMYTFAEQWMKIREKRRIMFPKFLFIKEAGHDLGGHKQPGLLKNHKITEEQVIHLRLQMQYRILARDVRMSYVTNIARPQDEIATYLKSANDVPQETRARLDRVVAQHIIDENTRGTMLRFKRHVRPSKDEVMGEEKVKYHGKREGEEDDSIIPFLMQALWISHITKSLPQSTQNVLEAQRRAMCYEAVLECPASYEEEVEALHKQGYKKYEEARNEVRDQAAEQTSRVSAKRPRENDGDLSKVRTLDDEDSDDDMTMQGEALEKLLRRASEAATDDSLRMMNGDDATDEAEEFLRKRARDTPPEVPRQQKRPAPFGVPRSLQPPSKRFVPSVV